MTSGPAGALIDMKIEAQKVVIAVESTGSQQSFIFYVDALSLYLSNVVDQEATAA